jgi:hypothetical protein
MTSPPATTEIRRDTLEPCFRVALIPINISWIGSVASGAFQGVETEIEKTTETRHSLVHFAVHSNE